MRDVHVVQLDRRIFGDRAISKATTFIPTIGSLASGITLAMGSMIQAHIAKKNNPAEKNSVAVSALLDMMSAFVQPLGAESSTLGTVHKFSSSAQCDKQVKLLLQFMHGSLEDTPDPASDSIDLQQSPLGQNIQMCLPETPDAALAMQSLLSFLKMFVSGTGGVSPDKTRWRHQE